MKLIPEMIEDALAKLNGLSNGVYEIVSRINGAHFGTVYTLYVLKYDNDGDPEAGTVIGFELDGVAMITLLQQLSVYAENELSIEG
jgi:hypothetical protein